MHGTFLFLFTPIEGYELREAGEDAFNDYAADYLDENNWYEPMGIITGTGAQMFLQQHADYYKVAFGDRTVTPDVLLAHALKELAAELEVDIPPGADIRECIKREIPKRLSKLYAAAQGKEENNYRRSILSEAYELFCDCQVSPFALNGATPYAYHFFDLREDRWSEIGNTIRPQDAVLFMDIHT